MPDNQIDAFFTSEHYSMIENLNRISDDLLKVKWYFLATLGALGLAYGYVLDKIPDMWIYGIGNVIDIKKSRNILPIDTSLLLICILGNIIFWIINEYIISHGFLFRFIQAKAALNEDHFAKRAKKNKLIDNSEFHCRERLNKNPMDEKNFIRDDNLYLDYFIPDQFLPLYWASIWIIVLNTLGAILLMKSYNCYYIGLNTCILGIISILLIAKIYNYHIYKLSKFIKNFCEFQIIIKLNKEDEERDFYEFFKFNKHIIINHVIYIILFPIIGLTIHFFRIFLNIVFFIKKSPIIIDSGRSNSEGKKIKIIDIKNGRLSWAYWLLLIVV